MFLLDVSTSLESDANFEEERQFVRRMIDSIAVGPTDALVFIKNAFILALVGLILVVYIAVHQLPLIPPLFIHLIINPCVALSTL